jgi:predicted phosphodiesterase
LPVKRYIVLHDAHYPLTDRPTVKALLQVTEHIRPDGFIFAGDAFDFACISHHNANKPLFKPEGGYMKDIRGFDREILTPLEKVLPAQAERTWIIGNHERFEADLIESHPEFKGTIDHVSQLRLEERGWKVIPLGHAKKLGKLSVIHGEVLSGIGNQAGAFPSKKALEVYDGSVLAGHTHAPQSYTKVSPVDQTKKRMAWIAPIGGNINPAYLRNRPTAWSTGFTVVEVYGKNFKNFNVYPVITVNGLCAYGGKLYGKK